MVDDGVGARRSPKAVPEQQPSRRYLPAGRVPHLTPEERAARGKAARAEVPRSSHAVFDPVPQRPDPVGLLEQQAVSRLPELVPIRYGRMASSPFAFFRGAALVMASDLAGTPRTGLQVQACGDAHVANFGLFASPERQLVFDLNDFDETLPGPWEWDVKRFAASVEVAGRGNGFTDAERRSAVVAGVREYRTAMISFAAQGNLAMWYQQVPGKRLTADLAAPERARLTKVAGRVAARARSRDHLQALGKLTRVVNGEPKFVSDPPLLVPVDELLGSAADAEQVREQVWQAMRSYRSTLTNDRRHLLEGYRFVDLARKVVGVGSVGTRAWVALLLGRDSADPLLLQFKEAEASVLEGFVGRSEYANSGRRVVSGQRLMQATSDSFLGWQRVQGFDGRTRDFYIRQLHDWKGSFEVEEMVPLGLAVYAKLCGWTLARAHARSGDRIAIASYLGSGDAFDKAVATFAGLYADQNERDHAALVAAISKGQVTAVPGV